jgi:hypothetical protein
LAGNYDPLLIRWSNVDPISGPQPEIWYPTQLNTAGDLRVATGSRIVTSYKTRQEILIFTDFSVSSFQFLGTSEVFGLQELNADCSIMGPNVVYGSNNAVYWMGVDKFYIYNGRVDTLPCTLRQYIFQDINTNLADIFVCGGNAQFNEIIWFYASENSNTLNRYVIYNYQEQIWYYGQLERTFWTDAGYVTNPIAANNGWLYEHENGTDDGQPNSTSPLPISAYITTADIDMNPAGDKFILLRKIIPDINFTNSTATSPEAYMTVGIRNFPGEAVGSTATYSQDNSTTVTVVLNNHNLSIGDPVFISVYSGAAKSGYQVVTSVVDTNTFTYTSSEALSTSGFVKVVAQNVGEENTARAVAVSSVSGNPIYTYTNQLYVRARGRQMNFTIGSNTLGVQWQLGVPRFEAREDGRRGGENP